jgi:hypothetical protein
MMEANERAYIDLAAGITENGHAAANIMVPGR